MSLYYDEGGVQIHHGRLEDVLPGLDAEIDLVLGDPPTGETSYEWDRWPKGWPERIIGHGSAMWVFGSMRVSSDWAQVRCEDTKPGTLAKQETARLPQSMVEHRERSAPDRPAPPSRPHERRRGMIMPLPHQFDTYICGTATKAVTR